MAYLHSTAIGSIDVPGCEGDPSKRPHGDGNLDHLPQACSHCGCLNQSRHDIIRNGTMNSVVLLGQYNFQPVYLKLKKQRYLCKHCRRTTVAVTPLTRRHCFISNAVK